MSEDNDLEVWIDHAEDDFNATGKLLRGKKPSLYGACFHAQQCAEKYMKAMLASKGRKFPMTHDLNVMCVSAGINIGVDKKRLELLSAYAVTARYDREQRTMEDAKEAAEIAKTIRRFARTFLELK